MTALTRWMAMALVSAGVIYDNGAVSRAAEPNAVPIITPRGSSAADACDQLARQGMDVVAAGRTLPWIVPAELRFKPIEGRKLAEAVAAPKGLKVAWLRGERGDIAYIYAPQPDADVEAYARDIASADAEVRATATELTGLMWDVRVFPTLIAAASASDEKVAQSAVASLLRRPWAPLLATESIREKAWALAERELANCKDKDFESGLGRGGRLLEGMTVFGGKRALANVRKTLERPEPMARRMALEDLCRLIGPAALPDVEKALTDDNAAIRGTAVEMLGRIAGDKALERLGKALDDKEAVVRRGALCGLGWIGGGKAAALTGKALADPDEDIRKTMVSALKRIGGEVAMGLLEKAMLDKEPHVAWAAARALGSVGGNELVPGLEKKAAAGDVTARRLAIATLGEIGGPQAAAVLEAAATDPDASIRGVAVKSLALAGGDRAFDILLKMASEDKDVGVRETIVSAIPQCPAKYFAIMEKLSKDPSGLVRLAVPYAVRNFGGDDKVVAILVNGMKDPEGRVRQTTADTLGGGTGYLGWRRGRGALLDAVKVETDPIALDEELVCIGSWRGKASEILVARLRSEKDPQVVKAIARGMRRMTIHDPLVAKAFKDLNLPPDEIRPGLKRDAAGNEIPDKPKG